MKHFKSYILGLAALLLLNGCSKDDDKGKPATKAEYYFSAEIDGKKILIEHNKDNFSAGAGSHGGTSATRYSEEQSCMMMNYAQTRSCGFSIVKNFPYEPDECSQIEGMFHTGAYPFGKSLPSSDDESTDGVVIFYTDENGKLWSSDLGAADQTNSNFQIVEHIPNTNGLSQRISKAAFACNLYDGQGNKVILKNGEIRSGSVQCLNL